MSTTAEAITQGAVMDAEGINLEDFGQEYVEKALVLQGQLSLEKIPDDASYARVAQAGLDATANIKAIEAYLNPLKERRHAAWKRVCNVLSSKTEPFEDVKKKASRLCGAYQAEQERVRLVAEAAERERIRKEEDARRAQEAENLASEGRVEEGLAVLDSPAAPMAPVVSSGSAPRVKGVGKASEKYKASVTNLMELVKAVAEGKVPILALEPNEVFLRQQANSMRDLLNYPGVKVERDFGVSFRA